MSHQLPDGTCSACHEMLDANGLHVLHAEKPERCKCGAVTIERAPFGVVFDDRNRTTHGRDRCSDVHGQELKR